MNKTKGQTLHPSFYRKVVRESKVTKQFFLLIIFILGITSMNMQAQVTMGIDKTPVSGAILQLKEKDVAGDNANATRGLGLPRVWLPLLNQLNPMYSYTAGDIPSASDEEAHAGLVVYNLNRCLEYRGGEDGAYVWTGTKWEALQSQRSQNQDIIIEQDQDGNEFRARHFTSQTGDAGIWMIENLRAKTYVPTGSRTGDDTNVVENMSSTPSPSRHDYAVPLWAYPGVDTSDGTDPSNFNMQPDLGLLYNWAAATNSRGRGSGTNQTANATGEDVNGFGTVTTKIQGICPNGWHIPSHEEWLALEKVMYESPERYSEYDGTETWPTWNPSWDMLSDANDTKYRPDVVNASANPGIGHGNAMKSICPSNGYVGPFGNTYGKSYSAYRGGFAVLMTGYGYGDNNDPTEDGVTMDYGFITHIWTNRSNERKPDDGTAAYSCTFYSNNAGVARTPSSRGYLLSVRCKKD